MYLYKVFLHTLRPISHSPTAFSLSLVPCFFVAVLAHPAGHQTALDNLFMCTAAAVKTNAQATANKYCANPEKW